MHDLIPLDRTPIGSLSTADVKSVLGYAQASKAASTRKAYASDWKAWTAYCAARGACSLPASPATVAAYLAHLADSGRKASGIGRAAAGIAYFHRQAGVDPSPTAHQGVKQTMQGIRRRLGVRSVGKAPATADIIGKMLKLCPDTLAGKRDAALLGIGFAAALRRSELVAIEVEDITFVDDGLRLLIRRSKTDQTGEGAEIAVIRGVRIRPVAALQAWLTASGITSGPVFRAVLLGDRMSEMALTANCAARVVKRYAPPAGGARSRRLQRPQPAGWPDYQRCRGRQLDLEN